MSRVFICYSRKDAAFVDRLVADLKAAGVRVWRDMDDIPGNVAANTQSWRRAVNAALRECTHMIVVLSPDSVNSVEVEAEWNHFLSFRRPVYPIVHRVCEVPYQLHALQLWDARTDYEGILSRLVGLLLSQHPDAPLDVEAEATPAARRRMWPSVLMTMVGWGLGWAIIGCGIIAAGELDIFRGTAGGLLQIAAAVVGLTLAGLVTGLAMRRAEPGMQRGQVVLAAFAWVIAFLVATGCVVATFVAVGY
jgi:hypothetical protein